MIKKINKIRIFIGLENLREKLKILYDNYILNIYEDNTKYSVILKLIPNDI